MLALNQKAKPYMFLDTRFLENEFVYILNIPRWVVQPDGSISLHSGGLVMDIEGNSRKEGAQVIAWTPHGGANQKWRLVSAVWN